MTLHRVKQEENAVLTLDKREAGHRATQSPESPRIHPSPKLYLLFDPASRMPLLVRNDVIQSAVPALQHCLPRIENWPLISSS